MSKMIKYIDGNLIEYEILKFVDEYDPILRQPTKRVEFDNPNVRPSYIAFSLAETLSTTDGIALSANQIGLPYRAFVMNAGDKIWTILNPEIIWKSEQTNEYNEGCLSYPGLYLKVTRPAVIKLRFQAIGGEFIEQEFTGLSARVIQHEVDHLDGICFTDKVSPIKLQQAKQKVKRNLKKRTRVEKRVIS
jgi:peptide deformylase